jgi:succinate dehydrogenase/fumarate reductase flavoprotein subunit
LSGFTLTGDGAATVIAASIQSSTLEMRDVRVTGIVSDSGTNRWGILVTAGAVDIENAAGSG